jgi:hypothetical protein
MGLRPYWSPRILNIIQDLYFTGGNKSFAHQFRWRFPVFKDEDGVLKHEVPIGMVALIATGVSQNPIHDVWC